MWQLEDVPDLAGKVMIVTGANSGLGYETAKELSRKGAKVIMACRNPQRAEDAMNKIHDEIPEADLEFISLNLSSQKSVAGFADEYRRKYDRLDVLVNNAGIMAAPYFVTEDGFEGHCATNYLGHFALTGRLFDLLEATPGARVVSVSSLAYVFGNHFDPENLNYKDGKGYHRWGAYSRSKMEVLMYAYEMQRRLTGKGMSTLSLAAHPGLAQTNIMPAQAKGKAGKKFLGFVAGFLKPTIYGAMPTIRAATDPTAEGGRYYGPGKKKMPEVVDSNKKSKNEEKAKRLWEVSEYLTGIHYLDL